MSGNAAVKLETIIIIAKVKNRGSPLLINQIIVLESQLFESSLYWSLIIILFHDNIICYFYKIILKLK